jgi:hypothetical protein
VLKTSTFVLLKFPKYRRFHWWYWGNDCTPLQYLMMPMIRISFVLICAVNLNICAFEFSEVQKFFLGETLEMLNELLTFTIIKKP